MSEPWITEVDDTTALLQEEIARLEDELRLRDEALAASRVPAERGDHAADDAGWERRIADLTAELAGRDEMVAVLLDQVRLFEEAEETTRAEWEQLNRWVENVEHRVERCDSEGRDLLLELETERNRAQSLHAAAERDRSAWAAHRSILEGEVARLRNELSDLASRSGPGADAALEALESENRRLRETYDSLARSSAETAEVGTLRDQLSATLSQLEDARRALREALDDREQERNEHAAELAALRGQMVCESLKQAETPADRSIPAPSSAESTATLTPDERIRALRQHLLEIHNRDEEERTKNGIAARLSRLWRSTRPAR